MASKRVVVAGGNGFLGSRICKSAVNRGWSVTSLSRSGEPRWDTVTSSHDRPTWANSVEWAKADLLKPDTYKPFLRDADVVVHSMGILLEADYKGVVRGKEPVVSGLQRAFSSSKLGSQNPLTRRDGERLEPKERDGQLTYEIMNRDSAIALAKESSSEHVPTFVYISAASGAPMLPSRYITTKREAETTIASELPELRSIFIRPPFMYDSSRKITLPIALGGFVASQFNALLGNRLRFLGAMVDKPFQVDLVGEAVVEAMEDESIRGAVGTKQIENLATKAWRKSML
ncbi:ubiquinone biosynthesis protein COQ11 [Aspergillus novofumigatus IBT 16806]|uniref:NAD(P)-binding protein n=1 Tax=Aspergillus novofumigatus (strain IBT 16806) TaxID=1392255 RepID=A0A2I1C5B0_ASPN1|nr:NAD(P)-binding protein [Aspergillus novofumigatus IBT 16806]PKX92794.1 NAD(P)-binding protein [Aspergillus novofumigatus IBT 16806]